MKDEFLREVVVLMNYHIVFLITRGGLGKRLTMFFKSISISAPRTSFYHMTTLVLTQSEVLRLVVSYVSYKKTKSPFRPLSRYNRRRLEANFLCLDNPCEFYPKIASFPNF